MASSAQIVNELTHGAYMQVQSSLDMSSVDNVTAMVICFSKEPPPARLVGRTTSRGPSRSLSRECLSTLSSALLDAQCQPAGLGARPEPREPPQ